MTTAANVERHGRNLAQRNPGVIKAAAKIGFLARGLVWMTIGFLAFKLATGHSTGKRADRTGALQEIGSKPFGKFLLIAVVIAFAAYAIYNLIEAAFDFEGKGVGGRVLRLIRAVLYGAFALTTYQFVTKAKAVDNNKQSADFTAKLMDKPAGPILVGLVGLILIGVGIYNARKAFGKRYEEGLKTFELSRTNEKAVGFIARVGYISRGVVFAVIGLLFIQAAMSHNSHKATGLDGALRRLLATGYGGPLVTLLGLGLIAFGLFSLVEAKYRRIETS